VARKYSYGIDASSWWLDTRSEMHNLIFVLFFSLVYPLLICLPVCCWVVVVESRRAIVQARSI
jgi:endonuclease/exonuclease/phosphatase (EEP) superfamily protein YafD